MDSFKESLTRVGTSDTKSLQSLLKVAEELLFSFPLPTDIVKKYEFMRENAFAKLGLQHSFSRIWNLQREAHARSRVDKTSSSIQTNGEPSELRDSLVRSYRQTLESLLIDLDSFFETLKLVLGLPKDRSAPMFIAELDTYNRPRRGLSEDLSETQQFKFLQTEIEKRTRAFEEISTDTKRVLSLKNIELANAEAKTAEALRSISQLTAQYEDKIRSLEHFHESEKVDLEASISRTHAEKITSKDQNYHEAHRNYLQEIETLLRERDQARDEYRVLQSDFDRLRSSLKLDIDQVHAVYREQMEALSQTVSLKIATMEKMHNNQMESMKAAYERNLYERETAQSSKQRSENSILLQQSKDSEHTAIQAMETINEVERRVEALYKRYVANWSAEWRTCEPDIRNGLSRQLSPHMTDNHLNLFLELEFVSFVLRKHADKVGVMEAELAAEQQERRILELQLVTREPKKPLNERFREVQEDMDYAAGVLKDFEEARTRLLGQFPPS